MAADYHAIRLHGYLGVERYPELRALFSDLHGADPVLVDLREASGADSVFLSELLLFRRRRSGPTAVLIPATGNLAQIFTVVAMAEKMTVTDQLDAALRALGVAPD